MLHEDEIVLAILKEPAAHEALRLLARLAVAKVALNANFAPPAEDVSVIGNVTIDRLRRTITIDGKVEEVKPQEFALLETLARRLGFAYSRGLLVDLAWPEPDRIDDDRTVDVHIRRLRKKLGAAVNIRTVQGIGYALDLPDEG